MIKKQNYTDSRWQKKRLEIMGRDDFTCRWCFDNETELVVHHKKYIEGHDIWEYPNSDLITICKNCHEIYHNAKRKFLENIQYRSDVNPCLLLSKLAFIIHTGNEMNIDQYLTSHLDILGRTIVDVKNYIDG